MKKMVSCAAAAVALLLVGACSPDASAPATDQADIAPAARPSSPAVSAEAGSSAPSADAGAEGNKARVDERAQAESGPAAPASSARAPVTARRCGWLHNPTPGNWWLFDGHGEWILATQGSEGAAGMDDIPDMSGAGWVETNGHYGHGCACMTVTATPGDLQVVRISSIAPKPLKQCRDDPALPKP